MAWVFIICGSILLVASVIIKYKFIKITASIPDKRYEQKRKRPKVDNNNNKFDLVLETLVATRKDILLAISKINNTNKQTRVNNSIKMETKGFQQVLDNKMVRNKPSLEDIPEKYEKIIDLARTGKDCRQIAEELGLGVRETSLFLKYYQGKAEKYEY